MEIKIKSRPSPAPAKASTVPRPMPPAPPGTSAVLFFIFISSQSLCLRFIDEPLLGHADELVVFTHKAHHHAIVARRGLGRNVSRDHVLPHELGIARARIAEI